VHEVALAGIDASRVKCVLVIVAAVVVVDVGGVVFATTAAIGSVGIGGVHGVRHACTVALECAFSLILTCPTCPTHPMPQDSVCVPSPHKARSLYLHFLLFAIFLPHFCCLLLAISHLTAIRLTPSSNSQDLPLFGSTHQAWIAQNQWPTHRLMLLTALT